MANKSLQQIATDTRTARQDLMKLIDAGMSESAALRQVLPNDKNRTRTLASWKKHELWPVPIAELVTPESGMIDGPTIDADQSGVSEQPETGHTGQDPATDDTPQEAEAGHTLEHQRSLTDEESGGHTMPDTISHTVDDTPVEPILSRHTSPSVSGLTEEQEAAVVDIVRRELGNLLAGVKPEALGKPGRGGKAQTVKKTFSIPEDLWQELNDAFPEAIMSNQVTAALRLYLNVTKRNREQPRPDGDE
jgi:hypothetical protein